MRFFIVTILMFNPFFFVAAAGQENKLPQISKLPAIPQIRFKYDPLPPAHAFRGVDFSLDGKTLAVAATDKTIRFFDVETGKETRRFECKPTAANDVLFLPGGKRLAACMWNYGFPDKAKTIHVWDLTSGKKTTTAGPMGAWNMRCTPDGKAIAARGYGHKARIWNTATGEDLLTQFYHPQDKTFSAAAFSPDGKTWAVASDRKTIHLWDAAKKTEIRKLQMEYDCIDHVAFALDGDILIAGDSAWDVATGKKLHKCSYGRGCSISPDGRVMARPSWPGWIVLYEVLTGQPIARLKGHVNMVLQTVFSPDGKFLLSGSGRLGESSFTPLPLDVGVRLWDVDAGKEVAFLTQPLGRYISDIAFSPDGKRVAASFQRDCFAWNVPKPRGKVAPPAKLNDKEMDELWLTLAQPNAAKAYQAIRRLSGAGEQAVGFMKKRLVAVSAARVQQLVKQLNHDEFAEREKATRELKNLAAEIEPHLRKLLTNDAPVEVRARLKSILKSFQPQALPLKQPNVIRRLRTIQILERIGSKQAVALLKQLADGPADLHQTRHAQSALRRLGDM